MHLIPISESPADVQQLLVVKEEVPHEHQDQSPSLDQEDPDPPHVKEEQEELWTGQWMDEADVTKFPPTPVPVKSEDHEEEAQSSHLQGPDGQDCGGPEPAHRVHPHKQAEDSEDTEDSEDWTERPESESHVDEKTEAPASRPAEQMEAEDDGEDCGGPEPHMSPVHRKDSNGTDGSLKSKSRRTFGSNGSVDVTRARALGSSAGETASSQKNMNSNVENSESLRELGGKRKRHLCCDCGKTFGQSSHLKRHMRIHTGEKPFCCSVCQKCFKHKHDVRIHMATHTGEKQFACSVCGKRFIQKANLDIHMRLHTGEKPFCCLECGTRFTVKSHLDIHVRVHTGEKPFSCSVCKRRFSQRSAVQRHMKVHKPEEDGK